MEGKMYLWRGRCIYEGEDVFMKGKRYLWREDIYEEEDIYLGRKDILRREKKILAFLKKKK